MADKVSKRKTAYPVKRRVERREECGCLLVTYYLENPNKDAEHFEPDRVETYYEKKGDDCPHEHHYVNNRPVDPDGVTHGYSQRVVDPDYWEREKK